MNQFYCDWCSQDMHRMIWTFAVLLTLATANIEANPVITLQLKLSSAPHTTSWVASEYISSQGTNSVSLEDVSKFIPTFVCLARPYPKPPIQRSINADYENVSAARPSWSMLHRPNYPSEVNTI